MFLGMRAFFFFLDAQKRIFDADNIYICWFIKALIPGQQKHILAIVQTDNGNKHTLSFKANHNSKALRHCQCYHTISSLSPTSQETFINTELKNKFCRKQGIQPLLSKTWHTCGRSRTSHACHNLRVASLYRQRDEGSRLAEDKGANILGHKAANIFAVDVAQDVAFLKQT